jgi:DNA-binding transcriptional MerR regulator
MKDFLSIGQVAQETGIPTYKIKYALETLKIPAPTERFGHQRVFTRKDVDRVRKYFASQHSAVRKGADPS